MAEITQEEQEYYNCCVTIHNELSNTKLRESLEDLRDQTINRVARLNTDREVWKELGKLYIIDVLLNKKGKMFQEIKRIETIMNDDS